MKPVVACVPNFSEGRDRSKLDAIATAIESVPGALLLDRSSDADHNRSVITFAGEPNIVLAAAVAAVGKAAELIDLRLHTGEHPRIGATDVLPFVPVRGVTLRECADLAHRAGERVWRRLRVPVYFYESAALRPDRRNLANLRRGGFEGLNQQIPIDPDRTPDIGEPRLHPSAGAIAVGARKFLIAFNINLNSRDVAIAKRIASKIRSANGGLPCVKALGVMLRSKRAIQVSMNLTDFEQTSMRRAFEAVQAEAEREGVTISASEIIGLVPQAAIDEADARHMRVENFSETQVFENRLLWAENHLQRHSS